jgi:hypothetical protein
MVAMSGDPEAGPAWSLDVTMALKCGALEPSRSVLVKPDLACAR